VFGSGLRIAYKKLEKEYLYSSGIVSDPRCQLVVRLSIPNEINCMESEEKTIKGGSKNILEKCKNVKVKVLKETLKMAVY
jgi:hypothetical protein